MGNQTIILDFDGVINSYKKWTGDGDLPDPPVPGSIQAIRDYQDAGFTITIMSTRAKSIEGMLAIEQYLVHHGLEEDRVSEIYVTDQKVPAKIIIDDRAFHFEGFFPSADFVDNFKPWNRK